MSLVTTPTLMRRESSRLRQAISAVLPLPTGPATPTRNARMATRLKQEISLGQRQHAGGFTGEQFAVGANFIGFWIDLELGRGRIVNHVALADAAAVLHSCGALCETDLLRNTGFERDFRKKSQTSGSDGSREGAKHGAIEHRLRCWN